MENTFNFQPAISTVDYRHLGGHLILNEESPLLTLCVCPVCIARRYTKSPHHRVRGSLRCKITQSRAISKRFPQSCTMKPQFHVHATSGVSLRNFGQDLYARLLEVIYLKKLVLKYSYATNLKQERQKIKILGAYQLNT